MKSINRSGFRFGWRPGRVPPHALSATLVVKGTFEIRDGALVALPDDKQPHLNGDDFAPWKPAADILYLGPAPATIRVGAWSKSGDNLGPRAPDARIPGTYDAAWLRTHWPWAPADFDWTHFNAAPVDQRVPEYLRGDEKIASPRFESALPGIRPRWFAEAGTVFVEVPLKLDTLRIDVERVTLVWRGVMPARTKTLSEISGFLILAEPLTASTPIERVREEFAQRPPEPELPAPRPAAIPPIPPIDRSFVDEVETNIARMIAEMNEPDPVAAIPAVDGPPPPPPSRLSPEDRALWEEPEFPPDFEVNPATPTPPAPPAIRPKLSKEAIEARAASRRSFAGLDLTGADLSGLDLARLDFRGAVLRGAKFQGATLTGADFTEAVLSRSDFSNALLDGAVFESADLDHCAFPGASLRKAVLDGADLRESRLDGVNLSEASARRAGFSKCGLSKARLEKALLEKADFSKANLAGADLRGAVLRGASLDGASAAGALFEGADVTGLKAGPGVDITGADLRGIHGAATVWDEAKAAKADFTGADLPGANFESADLSGARFDGAVLRRARMDRAQLRGASLVRADLFRATLDDADLQGADLREASLFEAKTWGTRREGARFEGANTGRTDLVRP